VNIFSLNKKTKTNLKNKNKNKIMENMEYRQHDTETVKQSADFYKDALDLPDSIMDKYTQAMQEKVANIVE
jgi:hypothetical protein